MTRFAPLAAAAMMLAAPAHADDHDEAIGTWAGTLEVGDTSLRVIFVFSDEDEDGTLEGIAYSPDQTDMPLPVGGVALADDVLTVTIPTVGASYEGTWNGEAFVGSFSQGAMRLPLTLAGSDWQPAD
ncbi:hypothetical protein [Sphingomicrobium astaxanthinifaciens]|uniref:hypothetical protein n=1 Tax=Sphingomicrobium astaxanthinifaciens TaxID=1227949 RepID=UPI001FCB6EEF|nr:hypothetical protein [Sphingomicrobium astaxanthinifaciens]MCJ7420472.1 hypothetical protein [Sphingomicrobium astaxanthinifaciens]